MSVEVMKVMDRVTEKQVLESETAESCEGQTLHGHPTPHHGVMGFEDALQTPQVFNR